MLEGQPFISDQCGHIKVKKSLTSFYQSNPDQTKVLYDYIVKVANLTKKETVWDLYSGVGTIAMALSSSVKEVIALEEVSEAVENGRDNIALNQIKNIEIREGRVEDLIHDIEKEPDTVILDPPRKGCEKTVLNEILRVSPEKIIYISCNPQSLIRDLKVIQKGGYEIRKITPIDMFPQTIHVESISICVEISFNFLCFTLMLDISFLEIV